MNRKIKYITKINFDQNLNKGLSKAMKNDQIIGKPDEPFVDMIKKQLLSYEIKTECCKNSFACGVSVFERSRKNKYSEQIEEYLKKIKNGKNKKKKQFFADLAPNGYQMNTENGERFPESQRPCPHCAAHLLRGAFLVCGRAVLNDNGVSIEMVMPGEKSSEFVLETLKGVEVELKKTVRRGENLLYSKKTQVIEDFLSYIGALVASFYLMNNKIERGIMMTVSRLTNCDANNLVKVADAASRQNEAIRAIIRNDAMKSLPPTLRQTAEIRLSNPSETLGRLTALHGEGISRSGVNHRLQKIVAFAVKNGYIK